MNKRKHLIINLIGDLTEELGEEAFKKIEELAFSLKVVIFDCSSVHNLTPDGIKFLKNSIFLLREFGCEIALTQFKKDLHDLIQGSLDSRLYKVFSDISQAKKFFEDKAEITEDDIDVVPFIPEINTAQFKDETFYTYCPSCNVKLRLKVKGNYKCPSCSSKFYFNPIQESVKYERISLE